MACLQQRLKLNVITQWTNCFLRQQKHLPTLTNFFHPGPSSISASANFFSCLQSEPTSELLLRCLISSAIEKKVLLLSWPFWQQQQHIGHGHRILLRQKHGKMEFWFVSSLCIDLSPPAFLTGIDRVAEKYFFSVFWAGQKVEICGYKVENAKWAHHRNCLRGRTKLKYNFWAFRQDWIKITGLNVENVLYNIQFDKWTHRRIYIFGHTVRNSVRCS